MCSEISIIRNDVFFTHMPEPRSLGKNKDSNDHVHDECFALTIEKKGQKEH